MNSFFSLAQQLAAQAVPFATATVVRIERPTSGKPGDRAIVTLDGQLHGWIGGSCARPTVIREALACLHDNRPRLIRLSRQPDARVGREGITDLSMTCFSGGTMEIYIEPQQPKLRLLLLGNLPVAQSLLRLGRALDYEIVSVETYGEGELEDADRVVSIKELASEVHAMTYVIVATHGEYDELALRRTLEAEPPYCALVASKKRAQAIVEHVTKSGLDERQFDCLSSPAGLDLGARSPDEIALSILAEIVQTHRRRESVDWQTDLATDADSGTDSENSETG